MAGLDHRILRGDTAVLCLGDGAGDGVEAVRYAIRQVGAGWTVYDYRNLEPVRLQGRLLIGLEQEAARAMADALTRSARRDAPVAAMTLPKAA